MESDAVDVTVLHLSISLRVTVPPQRRLVPPTHSRLFVNPVEPPRFISHSVPHPVLTVLTLTTGVTTGRGRFVDYDGGTFGEGRGGKK